MKLDVDNDAPNDGAAGIMRSDDSFDTTDIRPPPSEDESDVNDIALDEEDGYKDEEEEDDEEAQQHDQLPTPEEYKAKLRDSHGVGRISSTSSKSRAGLFTFLGLLLVTIIVTSIAVPLALNNKAPDPYSGSSVNANKNNNNNKNKNKNDREPVVFLYDDDGDNDDGVVTEVTTPVASPTRPPVTISKNPPTAAPSMATATDLKRLEKTFEYLIKTGVARQLDLENTDTPVGKATRWIAVEDDYQMAIPIYPNPNEAELDHISRFLERWTLAVFYYSTNAALNTMFGEPISWRYQVKFLQPIDHCDWYETFIDETGSIVRMGVTQCQALGQGFGDDRNEDQMVARIELSNNQLIGSIPKEIKYLSRLEDLILPFNIELVENSSLHSLTPLSKLKHLELQYGGIFGTIPDDFGSLGALTFLGLGNNLLTGTIPDDFFKLTNLHVLGLDDNFLKSPIGPFANFTSMQKLYIEDNLITGMVTADMITNGWQNMIDLDVSVNQLVGPLPTNIWSMPEVEVLDLHGNQFIGAIPEIDAVHEKVTFFAVQNNTLEWRIPEGINKLVNLAHLDISFNNMVVPFPSTMNQLSNLRSLYTGSNNFDENPFPTFLESLTNLRELSMKQSKLTGTIPITIGLLTNMQVMDLDSNQLEGKIPSEMGMLTGLNTLMLNRNEGLTGTIPASFASLENVDILLLDGTDLSGTADVICSASTINTTFFSADCAEPDPELTCSCCHLCCSDNNATCNNFDWNINLDGIWEYDFQRVVYKFSQNILPAESTDSP